MHQDFETVYSEHIYFLAHVHPLTRAGGVEALLPLEVLSPTVAQWISWRAGSLPAHGACTTGGAAGAPRTPGAPASTALLISGASEWCQ